MIKKYDYSISLLRVLAMFSILACHLFQLIGVSWLGQFLNVGVQIFLLISGYLYGKKTISNYLNWIYNRYIRIFIPILIFVLFIVIYCNITSIHSGYMEYLVYVLGLQGIDGITGFWSFYEYPGTEHLWFITILMVCYLLTIPVSIISKRELKKYNLIILLIAFVLLSLILPFIGIYIALPLIYFVGYFYSKCFENVHSAKTYVILTIIMALSVGLRLIFKHYADGIVLYEYVVVPFSHNILALWIFLIFRLIYKKREELFKKIAQSNVIMHLDSISYYIYIVHYMFMVGPFVITDIISNQYLAVFAIILLSFVCAELLYFISKRVINKLKI